MDFFQGGSFKYELKSSIDAAKEKVKLLKISNLPIVGGAGASSEEGGVSEVLFENYRNDIL